MTRATRYPPADQNAQWYGNGNATVTPTAMLWHTTETAGGWPDYSGGSTAPNLTYEPWRHQWRQHFPINGTARALKNGANGYQTNRQGVCQVEISCYSDSRYFSSGKGIDRLDDQAYADLNAFARFLNSEWGIPLQLCPYPFVPVGQKTTRFSESSFPPFYGHCGHQHAPDNDHADPGNLDVGRIIGGGKDLGDWLDMASEAEVQQAVNDGVINVLRGGEAQQIIRDQVNSVLRSQFNHPDDGQNGECFDRVIQASNISAEQLGLVPVTQEEE